MGLFDVKHIPFRDLFNRRLLFTVVVLALSQFNFGFEGNAFSNIQAMDSFIQDFGQEQPDGTTMLETQWLSFFNGFSIVGFAVGKHIGPGTTLLAELPLLTIPVQQVYLLEIA